MMKMKSKTAAFAIAVLIMAAILSACGSQSTPEPTPDMNAYATNAVQTVEAHYTATALAQPTNTPEPTYTPVVLPTDTPEPIAVLPPAASSAEGAPAVSADPAGVPQLPMGDAAQAVQAPVVPEVPTATAVLAGDKASWDSQTPVDGSHVEAGSEFDITWYLLNTGTTTWTTDYCLRYFTGTNFTKPGKTRTHLAQPVAPNTIGACTVDAVAPTTPGTYTMSVVLGNENDENFFIVDITIIVD